MTKDLEPDLLAEIEKIEPVDVDTWSREVLGDLQIEAAQSLDKELLVLVGQLALLLEGREI